MYVAVLCALVGLSALGGVGLAAFNSRPIWFLLGFEVVIAFASVFGVLLGLGRFNDAPALGLLCVAGAVGGGSLLGFLSARHNLSIDPYPFLLAREVAAAALIATAALIVLFRRPRESLPKFAAGVGCGAALVLVGAGAWMFRGQLGALGTVAGAVIGLIVSALMLGLLAAAVHLLVAAFETGESEETRG